MYRILINLFAFSFLISIHGFSQRLYFNTGLGYNLTAGSGIIQINPTNQGVKNWYGSYGEGLIGAMGLGYMVNENLGCELGFSILAGKTFDYSFNSNLRSYRYSNIGKMKRLIPALKITFGSKLKPYAKIGGVLGLKPEIIKTVNQYIDKYSGGTSIGFMSALGVDIQSNESVSIFVEIVTISQSWAPKKIEIETPNSHTTIYYVDKRYYGSGSNPEERLKVFFPFGSVGINAGIKMTFGSN